MICPNCKQEIKDNSRFCGKCGSKIPRCPTCGKVLTKKTRFCVKDGTQIPEDILNLIPKREENSEDDVKKSFCVRCGNLCTYGEKLCSNCKNSKTPKASKTKAKVKKKESKNKGCFVLLFIVAAVVLILAVVAVYAIKNDIVSVNFNINGDDSITYEETEVNEKDLSENDEEITEDEDKSGETTTGKLEYEEITTEKDFTEEDSDSDMKNQKISGNIDSSSENKNSGSSTQNGNPSGTDSYYSFESLMTNYCTALCSAINSNNYSLTEPYILKGSSLESAQKSLVSRLSSKGITENFVSCTVNNTEQLNNTCYIYVTETEKVNYADGSSETLTYDWKYTAVYNNGDWQLSDIS